MVVRRDELKIIDNIMSMMSTIIIMLLLHSAEVNCDLEDPVLQCIGVATSDRHTNLHNAT